MSRVDLSIRQAILLNDLALVRRLLKHHPEHLHNPDFADKSNTSLHLAAQHGLTEIAVSALSADCLDITDMTSDIGAAGLARP